MATALGAQWSIHGLPHSTVPAAARTYLHVIKDAYPEGTLHLLGHSFGGWMVFEMALRLPTAGRKMASVTLLDAEVPEGNGIHAPEYNRTQVFMHLVELSEQNLERSLDLVADDFDGLDFQSNWRLHTEALCLWE